MDLGIACFFESPAGRSEERVVHEQVDSIEAAEAFGFDAVWLPEHHFSEYGVNASPSLLLAAAARATRRIRLGAAVVVLPLNHPVRVAEEYATLDLLSGGRVDLGVGHGFLPEEFRGYGVDQMRSRQIFEESVDVIRCAWTTGALAYDGAHYSMHATTVRPRPVQEPHPPIWMAAVTPPSFRQAGRLGLHLLCSPLYGDDVDQIADMVAVYRAERASAGHDPDAARIAMMSLVHVGRTDEEAIKGFHGPALWQFESFFGHTAWRGVGTASPGYETYVKVRDIALAATWDDLVERSAIICGGVDTVSAKLQAARDRLGLSQVICWTRAGGLDVSTLTDSMQRLVQDVKPRLSR